MCENDNSQTPKEDEVVEEIVENPEEEIDIEQSEEVIVDEEKEL